ncbi:hypothetical protein NHG34_06905 [Aerococcaceae bacterium NML190938]|nr:hypothetical protein [Aerococcaceae bacterium NML190938]
MHKKHLSFKSFTYVTLLTLTITSTPTVLAETLGNEVEHMNAYSQELPTEISEPAENSEHVENNEEEMDTVNFSESNNEEANERAKLTQKIEEGVQKALTTPGFVLVDGHNAYIQLIQNAASIDEVDQHLAELKTKADSALAFQKKREEANDFIANNYKYLGERLADYNSFIEQEKTEKGLEQIKAKAEDEHKKILIKLSEDTIERINKTQEQINALPELDANNPDYSIQRQLWSIALKQIPNSIAYTNTVKRQNSSAMNKHYEDSLLHWEIYANIELLSRKAAEYRKAFPSNEALSNKVRDMIYAEGTPYSTIEGAQEIPYDGHLRIFFKRDIVDKFKEIEVLYNQLIATEEKDQPKAEPKPQPEMKPQPEAEPKPQPEMKPQPETETKPQPEVKPQPETEPKPQPEVKPQPETETKPQPEVKPQPETEPQPEAQPKPETKLQPEAQPKPETKPKPEAQPQPEVKPQPDVKPQTEMQPKQETQPKAEMQPQTDAQPKSETKPQELVKAGEEHSFSLLVGFFLSLFSLFALKKRSTEE